MLFEVEFYREHKLAWADIIRLINRILLVNIDIYDFINFSVADIQPFEFKIDFFLNPSVLIRQIEEWVFVRITFCRSDAVVPVESKCMIIRRINICRQIMVPARAFLRCSFCCISVIAPVHTDVIIYAYPAEIGVVEFGCPSLSIGFASDCLFIEVAKRIRISIGKTCRDITFKFREIFTNFSTF